MPGHSQALPPGVEAAVKTLSALKKRGECHAFEVYYSKSRSTRIESKDQKVESLTSSGDVGLSIRAQVAGRVGFSFTTSIEPSAVEHAVHSAIEIASIMSEDPERELEPFASDIPVVELPYDLEGLRRPTDEKVKLAFELEKRVRSLDRRIQTVRSAAISQVEAEWMLLNSWDQRLSGQKTMFTSSVSCKAEENGDAQMGGDYQFAHHLKDLPIELTAQKSVETATELLGAIVPTTRTVPGIIRNAVVGELLGFLSDSFFGEEIFKGKSMLQGKLGEKVFSDLITIVDDALLPGGYATRAFDGEGSRSTTVPIIEQGVFKAMLLDRLNAKRFKSISTGHTSRGIQSPPSASLTNLYLKPGQESFDSLVQEMKNGIIITDLMGVHTANSVTGNFSLGASGLIVENGKITQPVKGFAVAGNILDLFKQTSRVASDLEWSASIAAPSLLLPEIQISGA